MFCYVFSFPFGYVGTLGWFVIPTTVGERLSIMIAVVSAPFDFEL